MSNKKIKIKATTPETEGGNVRALFAVEKENYLGKILRIEGELTANTKLVADVSDFLNKVGQIPKVDRTRYFDSERKRLAKEYELYGPYLKVLTAMMEGIKPGYDLMVEGEVRAADDDYFYLRVNNNITTEDMAQLYAKILKFVAITKNKPTKIFDPQDNWDEIIIKMHSEGVPHKKIGEEVGLTEVEVGIRLNRLKNKRIRYKKP
jgi:hypothetical protein